MTNKAHHTDPAYRRAAAIVRAQAYGDDSTRCRRCGLTLAEARLTQPSVTWDAGHVVDGLVWPLALVPEHSSCNRSAGATALNVRRGSGYDW